MNDAYQYELATESLEGLRRRLLDLTARNRLLNFTHGRQGNVRIIDELPDELHRMLLSEEELRFQAIPDPTREQLIREGYIQIDPETGLDVRAKKDPTAVEWARLLGYATDFELPVAVGGGTDAAKHLDKKIQTLMFPSEMEARLRALRNKAETAIEETGANICYVAFGFLEWLEGPDSQKPRQAPLLLVPVRIAKGRLNRETGTYDYTISYTGEDILPNLSLREMLRVNFALALPDLDDSTPPEAYFAEVARLIAQPQPRWRVWRYATVALFNFSKLLMYLDLDAERWPSDRPILGHPIVSRFFASAKKESNGSGFGDEHAIDDLPDVHELYPLVDDADSSQHSALVDAMDGKNLVIEGPPGTGKSQTITNLIAAALAQGKRVLFVAEKLAALEVVKRRLDHAGLGDFCLELHSHKTQKRKVLDDVASRMGNRESYRHPEQIEADIARYESLKEQLRGYASLINSKWKRTGLTIHEILMAASRYREELGIDPALLHPEGYDGDMFAVDVQRQSLDEMRLFAEVYRQIALQLGEGGDLQSHPWYGVGNRDLQLFDKDRVCASLTRWQEALVHMGEVANALGSALDVACAGPLDEMQGFERLKDEIKEIPPLHGDEILTALPELRGANLAALTHHLQLFREISDHQRALADRLRPEVVGSPESRRQLAAAWTELKRLGLEGEIRLGTVTRYLQRIDRLQQKVRELGTPMAEVATRLGHSFTNIIKLNETGLSEFRALVDLVRQLKPALLKQRGECFDDDGLGDLLPELRSRLDALNAARAQLEQHFALDRLPAPAALEQMRTELNKTGLIRWFNGAWRASRRSLLGLAATPGIRFKALASRVDALYAYARAKQSLEQQSRFKDAPGAHFAGMDTPIADLVALRDWYKAVRRRYGIGFGPKAALGDAVLGMRSDLARGIQSLAEQGVIDRADGALREIGELKTALSNHSAIQDSEAPLVAPDGPWSKLRDLLRSNLAISQGHLNDPDGSLADLESTATHIAELEALLQAWSKSPVDPQWFGGEIDLLVEPAALSGEALALAEHTRALAQIIDEGIATPILQEAIYRNPSRQLFEGLRRHGQELALAWQSHLGGRTHFADLTELDLAAWQRTTDGRLEAIKSRNQRALDAPDWLSNWLDYVRLRYRTASVGFGPLVKAVEGGSLTADRIDAGYKLAVHDLLARQILKEMPRLAQFSGNTQQALQSQFRQYDEKLKRLQRERIAWRIAQNEVPVGQLGAKVSSYTDLALLKRECAKKKRHIPLRQLVLRAGNALAALKPCFMMGPMSVAQYLAPGDINFDLVVMDEASQIRAIASTY